MSLASRAVVDVSQAPRRATGRRHRVIQKASPSDAVQRAKGGDYNAAAATFVNSFFYDGNVDTRDVEYKGLTRACSSARRAVVARATGEDATRRRAIDASDANAVARAAAALRRGGVIAVPTDTIYGFAASAANGDAVRRLYEIKGRRAGVPLAIAVGDVRDVGTYGDDGHLREGALARLLPGPTTVLLRRRRGDAGRATPELNPGVDLIGIRVPAHDFVREVCRAHGGAIALTSANRSGETSATAAEEFAELWDACDEVFDGGAIPAKRLGSTIVDLSSRANDFAIVRAGERCDELVRVLEGEFAMTRRDA